MGRCATLMAAYQQTALASPHRFLLIDFNAPSQFCFREGFCSDEELVSYLDLDNETIKQRVAVDAGGGDDGEGVIP